MYFPGLLTSLLAFPILVKTLQVDVHIDVDVSDDPSEPSAPMPPSPPVLPITDEPSPSARSCPKGPKMNWDSHYGDCRRSYHSADSASRFNFDDQTPGDVTGTIFTGVAEGRPDPFFHIFGGRIIDLDDYPEIKKEAGGRRKALVTDDSLRLSVKFPPCKMQSICAMIGYYGKSRRSSKPGLNFGSLNLDYGYAERRSADTKLWEIGAGLNTFNLHAQDYLDVVNLTFGSSPDAGDWTPAEGSFGVITEFFLGSEGTPQPGIALEDVTAYESESGFGSAVDLDL